MHIREVIVKVLQDKGGHITDSSGSAGRILCEKVIAELPSPVTISFVSGHLKALDELGFIDRAVRGKRTYRVALTGTELPPMPETTSMPRAPRKPRKVVEPPSADEVAEALLKQVLRKVDEKDDVKIDRAMRDNMARQVERLNDQIVQLKTEIAATEAKLRRANEQKRDAEQDMARYKKANGNLSAQIQTLQQEINRLRLGVTAKDRPAGTLEDRLDPKSKAALDAVRNGESS